MVVEESIKRSLIPAMTKNKEHQRRNSTGIMKEETAPKSSTPNYLRASTGSCHDFCKYGGEHSFSVKARKPIMKRVIPHPADKQKKVVSEVIALKKKTSVVKLKPSTDLKVLSSEQNIKRLVSAGKKNALSVEHKPSPVTIRSPELPEVIKREIVLPRKSTTDTKILMKDKEIKMTSYSNRDPAPKSKPVKVRPSSSSIASVESNGSRKNAIGMRKVTVTSSTTVKKLLAPPTASPAPKPSKSISVSSYVKHSSLKPVAPIESQYRALKAKSQNLAGGMLQKAESRKAHGNKVQEKILHVVEPETKNKILECVQGDGINRISPFSSPLLKSPTSVTHPDPYFVSSHGDEVMSESTDKEVLEHSESTNGEDIKDSEYTDTEHLEELEYTGSEADEYIYKSNEIVDIKEVDTLKGHDHQSPRKGRLISAEDKDNALTKSKFRKGKIIDVQNENNAPRRLKFRRGRVLDSNESNNYARRRSFKKRDVGDDENGTRRRSEKVVLRHQDMQGKKDGQGLLNNVIEETASKLVESRKSKVKALVGAFETVISLQETKPSMQTGT